MRPYDIVVTSFKPARPETSSAWDNLGHSEAKMAQTELLLDITRNRKSLNQK
jgi:hypothetical protein